MKIWSKTAFVALAMLSAQAAQAVVVFTSATLGRKVTTTYTGRVTSGGNQIAAPELMATTVYTLASISADQKSWTFNYSITNNSSVTAAMMAVGFDANPTTSAPADTAPSAVTATGKFNNYIANGQFPVGYGRVDVCLSVNSGCTGGNPNNALAAGSNVTGTFILQFAHAPMKLELDRFVSRFQAISPTLSGQNSGIAIAKTVTVTNGDGSPGPIPEPAQWLLMIGGFGVTGLALRRRKAAFAA